MAEFTATAIQTVAAGGNVLLTDAVRFGRCCPRRNIFHRPDTGTVKVRGECGRCFTRVRVFFSGNIAVPTGGTVDEITIALAIDGEPIAATIARFTPAAVEEYGSVTTFWYFDVPADCCTNVSVVNATTQPINVQNANLVITKA
jgi:hypothetical protein